MNFIVKLADKYIEVNSVYPELKNFLKDYLVTSEAPDFSITLTEKDILEEREMATDSNFSDTYLETLATLRKLAEILPSHNRILMHGASITYGEHAYLFTAPSGTGKSTHIRLWKKFLGEDVNIVNGDKPFISLDEEPFIYGNPWAGKENWHKNRRAPLKSICFVQRGTVNSIREIAPDECLTLLFKQVYLPCNSDAAGLTLELIDTLVRKVPLYVLTCDMSEEAVQCSFEALTGLPYPNK